MSKVLKIQEAHFLSPTNLRAYAGEFFGTMFFVYIGCGTVVSSQAIYAFDNETILNNSFLISVAMAFGMSISVLAWCLAPISGGHMNPAVTFALWLVGEISLIKGLAYSVAQLLGAFVGSGMVWGTTNSELLTKQQEGHDTYLASASNVIQEDLPIGSAFLGEMTMSCVLVFTVLMTAGSKRSITANLAPLAIGLSVMLAHLVLVPLTGCGINPARSFGPHMVGLISGANRILYDGSFTYYVAPFCGSAWAVLMAKYIFRVGYDDDMAAVADQKISDDPSKTEETKQEMYYDTSAVGKNELEDGN